MLQNMCYRTQTQKAQKTHKKAQKTHRKAQKAHKKAQIPSKIRAINEIIALKRWM